LPETPTTLSEEDQARTDITRTHDGGHPTSGEINAITTITSDPAKKNRIEVYSKTPSGKLLLSGKIQKNDCKIRELSHISEIENPANAQQYVSVEAIVSSTSRAYTIPRKVKAHWWDKEELRMADAEITASDPLNMGLAGANTSYKQKALAALFPATHQIQLEDQESRTVFQLSVRPPVFTLEKRGGKILDDHGFEYKSYNIYVSSERLVNFPASSLLRLTGAVQPDPKTQRTTLLVTEVEFPDEVHSFDTEKLAKLSETYGDLSHAERLSWVLENFQRYSRIIGRGDIATAVLLGYFTPLKVELDGEVQRGWCNILIIGDTTTGKTETVRKMLRLLDAGSLITAETASAVGLVGAATQSDKGSWSVDWGALVLNDRRLIAVDGAHKLSKAQHASLAEAERSGTVSIMKAAKESAYARTRQIRIANPLDPESRRGESRNICDFMHPAQAVPSFLDLMSIARLDLAVFANSDDVTAKDINHSQEDDYDRRLELLSESLRWVWSDNLEIRFTPEAVKLLHSEATRLYDMFYSKKIPLASIDMKWKLARLSASAAAICLSTGDYNSLTVEADHVAYVSGFIEGVYQSAGLDSVARFDREDSEVTPGETDEILAKLSDILGDSCTVSPETILGWIVNSSRFSKAQLMEKFEIPENNVLRPLVACLSSCKLIRQGQGFYPTVKLIKLYRLIAGIPVIAPERVSPPIQRTLVSEVA